MGGPCRAGQQGARWWGGRSGPPSARVWLLPAFAPPWRPGGGGWPVPRRATARGLRPVLPVGQPPARLRAGSRPRDVHLPPPPPPQKRQGPLLPPSLPHVLPAGATPLPGKEKVASADRKVWSSAHVTRPSFPKGRGRATLGRMSAVMAAPPF